MHLAVFLWDIWGGTSRCLVQCESSSDGKDSDAFVRRMADLPLAFEPGTQ